MKQFELFYLFNHFPLCSQKAQETPIQISRQRTPYNTSVGTGFAVIEKRGICPNFQPIMIVFITSRVQLYL